MKTLIISLLFILTANAQNIWYVNANNTSGPWNGRSWATAWRYLDSSSWAGTNGINWAIIQPGDTIFVSGGVDSLVYTPSLQAFSSYGFWISPDSYRNFTSGPPVVLTSAWHPNHNGKVIFATSTNNQSALLRVRNISNLKIRGFTFEDRRASPTSSSGTVMLGDYSQDSYLYFEDNHIIGRGNATQLHLGGYHTTVRNNVIEHLLNNNPADCDMITISGGGGSFTIDRNIIIQRNTNTETDAHRDMIQISNLYGSGRIPIIISNNLIIETESQGTSWNNMIYNYGWDVTPRIDMRIYNNIIVNRKFRTSIGAFGIGRLDANNPITLRIFNNTVINKGNGTNSGLVTNWGSDTLLVFNNLFVADTTASNAININTDLIVTQFNNNHYARYGASQSSFAVQSVTMSWTQWRALGRDINSTIGANTDVVFENKYGTNIEDYYTTTGRGAGVNLYNQYSYLRYDILGNPRPQTGAWDIGALQFQGSPSINVQGKIFLQGPFSSNSMSTNLVQNGFLPSSQPYNTAPWNYSGSEVLGSGAGPTAVDWVLVELRSSSNPAQVVGRRAAILRNDGRLVDTDGTLGVRFNNMNDGAYYVAVFHRNHLAIMSASPVQLSNNSSLYDFTNAMNKAYGTNPMASLPGGLFGMFSGDGNSDGGVTITDRNDIWQLQNGTMGYLKGDFNLDCGVNIIDANGFWSPNNGRQSQVP